MDFRAADRLSRDPEGVRRLATALLAMPSTDLADNELKFLTDLQRYTGEPRLTIRQLEFLTALRQRLSRRAVIDGFRASTLARKLLESRLDLEEDDEDYVQRLCAAGPSLALSDPEWRKVFHLCRRVGLMDGDYVPLA